MALKKESIQSFEGSNEYLMRKSIKRLRKGDRRVKDVSKVLVQLTRRQLKSLTAYGSRDEGLIWRKEINPGLKLNLAWHLLRTYHVKALCQTESQSMRKRGNRYAFPIREEMNQSMHGVQKNAIT